MKRAPILALGAAATLATATLALMAPSEVDAQVVREDGVSSVSGLLTSEDTSDEYKFKASAGDMIRVDVDADVYEMVGRSDDHHEMAAVVDDEEDGHDDGCGGPGGLILEILDDDGKVVCWADRPARPGWQRDAALHCPLMADGFYWLRIGLSEHDPHEHAADLTASEPLGDDLVPYLVNVSVRAEAPEGLLTRAIARSRNTLP